MNNCLNILEQVGRVQRNKDDSLPFPAILWIINVSEKKTREKQTTAKKFLS